MFEYGFLFLGFFLAGLAVNLTPCVYPMITVTVSLFKRKDTETEKVSNSFIKALFYVLGMAVMYSSLGLFAAMTGALFGGILQNRWVLSGVALLMFALALSMFGLYQIRLPSALLQRLGGQRKVNYFGLFISGILVGLFAAPCIGPPVIVLLTMVADRGDPLFGFFSFFIFSLGLGTPYLILGTFSGLLQKLPKAGSWLVWIEHVFGVILLGFALFYFVIAFWPDFIKWVLPLTVTLGGIYLGFIERSGREQLLFVRLKWGIGFVCFFIGVLLFSSTSRTYQDRLIWEPFTFDKLAIAQQQQKPVVIDFYADWCIACHELENFVFNHPSVAQELSKFVRLRIDATNLESSEVQANLERFAVPGLPIIVFIDARGQEVEEARITGYVPPADFLKSVQLALKRSQ